MITGPIVKKAYDDIPVEPSRSALMKRVRGSDTKPEMAVRKAAHAMGYRYRLHVRGLPGTPDLVFPRRKKVVFVHGCFWHRHQGCKRTTTPTLRREYWREKFEANVIRDNAQQIALKAAGWRTLVIWECETSDVRQIEARLREFLDN